MSWRVEFRPEVETEMAGAAAWYEARQPGLGSEFVEEVIRVWDALAGNPLLNCRRHPTKNIRWRYPTASEGYDLPNPARAGRSHHCAHFGRAVA